MGNLFENLKQYFENTPKDILEQDWREIEYLNEIGPDVIEYAEYVKEQFGIDIPYLSSKMGNKLNTPIYSLSESISSDALFCLAA